ncbi:unnamed protein product [Danaus chrysippus]|uniref:Malate dehydrogenase, mitochondrial n=1 Tax=Danaus chrysippus TaxID=151541 RepID=A0A8J2QHH6_9NEOP|nr:unnamed protein product [Danaus chrysippus]
MNVFGRCLQRTQLKSLCSVKNYVQRRNVQISIVGAASDIGKNVALLLKRNPYITRLHLYDDNNIVKGIGLELEQIPGGPKVASFSGDPFLSAAIRYSNLVLLVSRTPRKLGFSREQMLATNAIPVYKLCKVLSYQNSDAFFAISTNPINSIIPFANLLLKNCNAHNPFKLFGITHIDTTRARAFISNTLNVNPRHLYVPVIGGHSDETIVPLFSNLCPSHYSVGHCEADTLTRLIKKSGTEVLNRKHGSDSSTLAMAWSINEFVQNLIEALYGNYVVVNSYTANPHFGTKFFSGPTKVGPEGVIETCNKTFHMSDYETKLLERAIPIINKDVAEGEAHVSVLESARSCY